VFSGTTVDEDEDEPRNTGRHIEDVFKAWKKLLPSQTKTIQNCKDTIQQSFS